MKVLAPALFAAALAISPIASVAAQGINPAGNWIISSQDSRYEVTLCGDDGQKLCVKLVWLGNGADTAENLPYLGTYLIEEAAQTAPGEWHGTLHLYGQTADGSVKMVSDDTMALTGCLFAVICKNYEFYRINQ